MRHFHGLLLTAFALSTVPALAVEGKAPGRRVQAPSVSTVTLDFESGIKTTFYSDGIVSESGFDPSRMRRLATRRGTEAP